MACSRFLQVAAGVLLWSPGALPLSAQCQTGQPCDIGEFSGPWEWDAQVCSLYLECHNKSTLEFYHGAVLPRGLHKGKVLLTRLDSRGPVVNGECPNTGKLESWLFDPNSPDVLIHIQHSEEVPGFMNCAGNTWDPKGRLVMVGGAPVGQPNKRVYRFDPMKLGMIALKALEPDQPPPCSPRFIDAEPWSRIDDMETGRYYPTAMTATREPIDDPGGVTDGIEAATFAIGGPPDTGGGEGTYVWELLDPEGTAWARPLVPKGFPPVFPGTYEEFELRPVGDEPNPRLDSYPRAFQLSRAAQRQIFVAGDTQTGPDGPPPGLPALTGEQTWTMKIPYANLLIPQTECELWDSPEMGGQHSYGNAVLMFTKDDEGQLVENRVLVIGGGQHGFDPVEAEWPLVSVTDVVREFVPGDNAAGGQWEDKAPLESKRHHANSVLLPDGTILVAGGRSNVGGHMPNPVFQPEIYDPGFSPTDLGSSKLMATSNNATWGPGTGPTPRMYHSMAFLLPDGRVLLLGGRNIVVTQEPDSRMSGEIFSPPYLFEGDQPVPRPWILGVATSNQSFQRLSTEGDVKSFTVEVTTQAGKVKMVSAIRISSVTHHFDSDQRFIELDRDSDGVAGGTSIITVDAPYEDMAPQGWYYLFVLEEEGDVQGGRLIPSVAHFINFQ